MILNVFKNIKEKDDIPFFGSDDVEKIDLVSCGEGTNHRLSQRQSPN